MGEDRGICWFGNLYLRTKSHIIEKLSMEKGFLNGVEKNVAVRIWSERTQQEKCDRLIGGYESELWDFTRISVAQNDLRELKEIWNDWNDDIKHCFTFGRVDLVPTVEEYMALLNCPKIQADRAYSRPVNNLRDLILAHPDTKKRVDVFALSLYGLIVFPKALGYMDEAISDLFNRLDKGTTPILPLLESRKGLLSSFLQGLFPIKRISGYTEERRHLRRKMDSYSPEFARRRC
ncbi:hypothetical protein CXB51_021382 [Gossypium anomalum]|uniref:Aminotransferase-like plant mobile domain-containing protein n=1 Tax=Gossypium anomalum TaxID=47600 RepID=A0A8J5YJU7_9ROSI|nr:hypothetical protein CXB51_021382 [Gossypium anomalum]